MSKFIKMIEQRKLYNPIIFDVIYEYQRTIDYLYDFTFEPIIYQEFLETKNEEANQNQTRRKNITQDFYDGFYGLSLTTGYINK